ncbi:MAG: hypothetical protein HY920_03725 [Elusimicrobia bacterium]|nr:hypothetical protein [Elusimicrobiota bacterium]
MERINYLDHKGKTIIYVDFSKCSPTETQLIIGEIKKIVAHQAPGSVLTLINIEDMLFDKNTKQIMQNLAAHNRLFAKAEAVTGATGILRVIYDGIMTNEKNKVKLFDTKEAAKDWLAEQ